MERSQDDKKSSAKHTLNGIKVESSQRGWKRQKEEKGRKKRAKERTKKKENLWMLTGHGRHAIRENEFKAPNNFLTTNKARNLFLHEETRKWTTLICLCIASLSHSLSHSRFISDDHSESVWDCDCDCCSRCESLNYCESVTDSGCCQLVERSHSALLQPAEQLQS